MGVGREIKVRVPRTARRRRRALGQADDDERAEKRAEEHLLWARWTAIATLATSAVTLGTVLWAAFRK